MHGRARKRTATTVTDMSPTIFPHAVRPYVAWPFVHTESDFIRDSCRRDRRKGREKEEVRGRKNGLAKKVLRVSQSTYFG
jgi:hypothetical protein